MSGKQGQIWGGGDVPSLLRDSTPSPTKVSPLVLFYDIHIRTSNTKNFLKAPWAPKYTNFEEDCASKKRNFLVKIFQKAPKNGFLLPVFFSIICLINLVNLSNATYQIKMKTFGLKKVFKQKKQNNVRKQGEKTANNRSNQKQKATIIANSRGN